MHSIATEIAKEVLMLFQHRNCHPFARQQIAQHDACRTASYNAASCLQGDFEHARTLPPIQINLTDPPKLWPFCTWIAPVGTILFAGRKWGLPRASRTTGRRTDPEHPIGSQNETAMVTLC